MRILRHRPVPTLPLVTAVAGTVLVGVLATPAAAHVTVHSDNPTVGAADAILTFQVPNEQADAAVTRLEIQLPTTPPLLGVLVRPHPGWTSTVTMTRLATPAPTDDGPVTQAASLITWVASNPSTGIPAGQYDDFDISVGQLPTTPMVTFKAVQTYSNGTVARWIAPTIAGQPDPADPAPTLHLTTGTATTGTSSSGASSATAATGGAATATLAPTGTADGTSSSVPAATTVLDTSRDTTARVIAVIALVLAVIGTAGGFLTGRRTRTNRDPDTPQDDRENRPPSVASAPAAAPPTTEPTKVSSSSAFPGAGDAGGTRAWFTQRWAAADQTARRLLAAAAAGAVAVGIAAFLPWVDGTLSDRGVPLLTTHKYGVTNPLRGRWTLLLAAAALVLIALLAVSPAWKTRALVLAAV
ncbi:MAG: YcnI family protein, partial [Frankia sp.]